MAKLSDTERGTLMSVLELASVVFLEEIVHGPGGEAENGQMTDKKRMIDEEQTQRDAVFNKRNEDVLAIKDSRRAAQAEKTTRLRALRIAKVRRAKKNAFVEQNSTSASSCST
jgi:hypothetical protein